MANVDVSNFKYFFPRDILMLVQYFVIQNSSGIDGKLLLGKGNGWYIYSINMVEFCNTNYDIPNHVLQSSPTAIPIKRVDTSTMNEYILDAQAFFRNYCPGKDISALNICISEIINNVYDHSRSKSDAYIFSQFYKTKRQIRFAISDLGVGIVNSVNNYMIINGEEDLSDFDALTWAFKKGQSVKSKKYNMGVGFENILKNLLGVGEVHLFTGNLYCYISLLGKMRMSINPIQHFIGTLIEIVIYTEKLEKIDETVLEDYIF